MAGGLCNRGSSPSSWCVMLSRACLSRLVSSRARVSFTFLSDPFPCDFFSLLFFELGPGLLPGSITHRVSKPPFPPEVSIDPKGLQTQRVSKVWSCVQIQIETKGRGHVVGFAVKVVTGRDESQGCNEMQAHRGGVSCRSLVALAHYTHAMHVCFDGMPVLMAFCGVSVAHNEILIILNHLTFL